jgi:hypothetical protein
MVLGADMLDAVVAELTAGCFQADIPGVRLLGAELVALLL